MPTRGIGGAAEGPSRSSCNAKQGGSHKALSLYLLALMCAQCTEDMLDDAISGVRSAILVLGLPAEHPLLRAVETAADEVAH